MGPSCTRLHYVLHSCMPVISLPVPCCAYKMPPKELKTGQSGRKQLTSIYIIDKCSHKLIREQRALESPKLIITCSVEKSRIGDEPRVCNSRKNFEVKNQRARSQDHLMIRHKCQNSQMACNSRTEMYRKFYRPVTNFRKTRELWCNF